MTGNALFASLTVRTALRATFLVSLSLSGISAQASDRMTPGQWELTTTTKGESQVLKFCADPATLAIANGDDRSGREALVKLHAKTGCTVTDFTADGSTLSYALTCRDRTVRTNETYHGDRYEGILKTKLASGAVTAESIRAANNRKGAPAAGPEEVTSDYKARRLGACH